MPSASDLADRQRSMVSSHNKSMLTLKTLREEISIYGWRGRLVGACSITQELLGMKVHVGTEKSRHGYVRDRILGEATTL